MDWRTYLIQSRIFKIIYISLNWYNSFILFNENSVSCKYEIHWKLRLSYWNQRNRRRGWGVTSHAKYLGDRVFEYEPGDLDWDFCDSSQFTQANDG
jgi:hypothetical protein